MANASSGINLSRSVMWQGSLENASLEQAHFRWTANGARIAGTVLTIHRGVPLRVDYRIESDRHWQTRLLSLDQRLGDEYRTLRLAQNNDGAWTKNGEPEETLAGCTDVDLGITPSTNTLPIRRLSMPVGGSKEIDAAWVRVPGLSVTRTRQRYSRGSEYGYTYQNLGSGFKALVTVDADGVVTAYDGVWKQIAESAAPPERRGFADALTSDGPSAELGAAADAFGWLIGGWSAEVRDIDADGRVRKGTGEWWFSWVLEGRAVQDVWIVPVRADRSNARILESGAGGANNRYGTSVRWFDSSLGRWRIVWINPVSGALNFLAGQREGNRILLEGLDNGKPIRWKFEEIRRDSFVWRGESRGNNGSWRLDAEFLLKRIA